MFAVVLKNTILILFIVCIGYFLVDNHLNELENESKSSKSTAVKKTVPKKPAPKAKPATVPESKSILKDIIASVQKEAKADIKKAEDDVEKDTTDIMDLSLEQHIEESTSNPMKLKVDEGMKEIYNYVFNDKKAHEELSSIYDATKVSNVHKDESILCESKEDIKIKNMCNNPIGDHHSKISYEHIESTSLPKQSMYDFVDKNI